MTVYLNEKPVEITNNMTLSDFLVKQKIPSQGVAVAINQKVIPRDQWKSTLLADQQSILLIHIVSGG
ncbi:MAG: sulfur carrier protein ThiS [Bacteroidales bacterium]|nr:sulfur carrier protein ThiS [Bacteroidales bacterium]